MTRYSVQPRDLTFLNGCEFLSSAKNMSKNNGKTLGSKYSQELPDHAKQFTTA